MAPAWRTTTVPKRFSYSERGKRAWMRSGGASVVRSQSAGLAAQQRVAQAAAHDVGRMPAGTERRQQLRDGRRDLEAWAPRPPSILPPGSVAEEEVGAPALVAVVAQVGREERVDVAARLERPPGQAEPGLLEQLAALAVVAGLAGRDQVVPGCGRRRDGAARRGPASGRRSGGRSTGRCSRRGRRPRGASASRAAAAGGSCAAAGSRRARGTPPAASGSPGGRTRALQLARRRPAGRRVAGCTR